MRIKITANGSKEYYLPQLTVKGVGTEKLLHMTYVF